MTIKIDECKLISGKDALIALANGEKVECTIKGRNEWGKDPSQIQPYYFIGGGIGQYEFRLKPRTITINGIEVPAPAEDEDYHHQGIWILNSLEPKEYGYVVLDITDELPRYWWRTEEEIKQVVAALRQVFGGSHDN